MTYRYKNFLLLSIAILLTACTSDDSASDTSFSYLPLSVNNSWTYDVTTGTTVVTDMLTVNSTTGSRYTLTSNPTPGNGVMTNLLTSGELNEDGGKLVANGSFSLANLGFGNFNVAIVNGVLNDQNAGNGTETFTTSGMFSETVQSFNLVFNYTAKNIQRADLATLTVNGTTYNDVEHSQLIINANIVSPITVANITQNITLMRAQDVIVIDNYWAKDVGLIKSDNQLDYMLEDFSSFGIMLPVPQAADLLSVQTLTSFTVN
ncbi:MAG: chorismate synthase [Nonlabens sp.]|nr:chorismate synthase [Nonlabens sp.]